MFHSQKTRKLLFFISRVIWKEKKMEMEKKDLWEKIAVVSQPNFSFLVPEMPTQTDEYFFLKSCCFEPLAYSDDVSNFSSFIKKEWHNKKFFKNLKNTWLFEKGNYFILIHLKYQIEAPTSGYFTSDKYSECLCTKFFLLLISMSEFRII